MQIEFDYEPERTAKVRFDGESRLVRSKVATALSSVSAYGNRIGISNDGEVISVILDDSCIEASVENMIENSPNVSTAEPLFVLPRSQYL